MKHKTILLSALIFFSTSFLQCMAADSAESSASAASWNQLPSAIQCHILKLVEKNLVEQAPITSHNVQPDPHIAPTLLTYNHNGTQLAACINSSNVNHKPATVWLMDPQETTPVAKLTYSYNIYALAYNHDGTQLAVATALKTIGIWDLETMQEVLQLKTSNCCHALSFSKDGSKLASRESLYDANTICVWDIQTCQKTFNTQSAPADSSFALRDAFAFSSNEEHIISGNNIYNIKTGGKKELINHDGVYATVISQDKKHAVALTHRASQAGGAFGAAVMPSYNRHLLHLNASFNCTSKEAPKHSCYPIHIPALSPDGTQLALSSKREHPALTLLDIESNQERQLNESDRISQMYDQYDAVFNPDGTQIAFASSGEPEIQFTNLTRLIAIKTWFKEGCKAYTETEKTRPAIQLDPAFALWLVDELATARTERRQVELTNKQKIYWNYLPPHLQDMFKGTIKATSNPRKRSADQAAEGESPLKRARTSEPDESAEGLVTDTQTIPEFRIEPISRIEELVSERDLRRRRMADTMAC